MADRTFCWSGEAPKEERLHYKDCGLDNVYLRSGFTREDYDGETYVTVEDIDGLHKAIGLHIVLDRKAPTGQEVRFLRKEMGLSQAELAKKIGTTDQSVARWEKAQCEISGPALFAIRFLYVFSLIPEDMRDEVANKLLEAIDKLSESDEVVDEMTFNYADAEGWTDKIAA